MSPGLDGLPVAVDAHADHGSGPCDRSTKASTKPLILYFGLFKKSDG